MTKKLLWLDLEMSGLDEHIHVILEVAAVVTGFDLEPIETYEAVVKQPKTKLKSMDPWSKAQHQKSGLLDKIPHGVPSKQVEQALIELTKRHFKHGRAILAGNSIHFDRRFIRKYWPKFDALLHYRMVDVSSFKIVVDSLYKHRFHKQQTHRALEDIQESILELKDYVAYLRPK